MIRDVVASVVYVSVQVVSAQQAAKQHHQQQDQVQQHQPDLSNVGLVLWQSGYVLSDFLLLRSQAAPGNMSSWAGVRVLELGCGGGTVGMFLALAGAQVGACCSAECHLGPLSDIWPMLS